MVYNPGMAGFYSGMGDAGYTGILGEGRLPKSHPRIEAIGAIDEATAALGFARSQAVTQGLGQILVTIQRDLYHVMAEVAATSENAHKFRVIDESRVAWLEACIAEFNSRVEMPKEFIVPGDSVGGAACALARTIIRRAERRITELFHEQLIENQELLRYLNRLSSFCFMLELIENQNAGIPEPTLAATKD